MAVVKFVRREPRAASPGFSGSALPMFATLDGAEQRMSRFIDRVLNEPLSGVSAEAIGWMPAMDIVETANELTVTAELAGIDPKDIDVSIEDGVLTVSGEKLEERTKDEAEKKVYLYERSYGSFQRSFAFPTTVDGSKITAEVDKGVLKIHLPKSDGAQSKGRKIEIKSA